MTSRPSPAPDDFVREDVKTRSLKALAQVKGAFDGGDLVSESVRDALDATAREIDDQVPDFRGAPGDIFFLPLTLKEASILKVRLAFLVQTGEDQEGAAGSVWDRLAAVLELAQARASAAVQGVVNA